MKLIEFITNHWAGLLAFKKSYASTIASKALVFSSLVSINGSFNLPSFIITKILQAMLIIHLQILWAFQLCLDTFTLSLEELLPKC